MRNLLKYVRALAGLITPKKKHKPLSSLKEAQQYVEENFQSEKEILLVASSLIDGFGINMAIIVDGILKKGYVPDGFEQKHGYRIYKYKKD